MNLYGLHLTEDAAPIKTVDEFDPVALRRAVERIRNETTYQPTTPDPISPAAHDATNELLGRPSGTPVTRADLARAQQVLYDRCTPEERELLVAMAFGAYRPT